jgi:hypothetical protein
MHLSKIILTTATLAGLAFAGPIAERQTAQKLRISKNSSKKPHAPSTR